MNEAYERTIEAGLREEFVREVGRSRYRLWFRDTVVQDVGESSITLGVPTEVHRTWLEYSYGPLLRRAVATVLGDGVCVRLEVSRRQGLKRAIRERLPTRNQEWAALLARRRPRPTLESFCCPPSERFAPLLLGQMVHGNGTSEPPAVYLFGEHGTGKTHLLRALHDAVEGLGPGDSLYLTSRRFTSLYVSALRARELDGVRAFEADLGHRRLVLLDEVDQLAGRGATQKALVRLRERAERRPTRFVFAANRHPRELAHVSPRLRSWFMGSVVLRLRTPAPPDLRDLLARRGRAYGLGGDVPEVVLDWILDRTGSVHGAVEVLDRWGAASAEIGECLDVAWLEEIAPAVSVTAREEVVRRAKAAVARHYGVPLAVLDAPTKVRSAARPRRVAMYLVYRATALPLRELGYAFGLKSHSSVSRAIREIRADRERDPELEQVIDGLLARM